MISGTAPARPAFSLSIQALRGRPRAALALGAGAGLASIQAPLGFFPAFVLALPVLIWLLEGAESPRACASVGWLGGTGYFAAGLLWIVEPFLVDPIRHGWMAPFALILMAGGLAVFWALGFAAARAVACGPWLAPALATTLTLAEYFRSTILTGFPWNLLAYGWLDTPVAQISGVIGPHGLGFLTVLGVALVAIGWRGWPVWVAALLVLGGWGYGVSIIPETASERATSFTVRLIQPYAPQTEKWTAQGMRAQYIRGLEASLAPGSYDAVIWPEAAVPQPVGEAERAFGGTLYRWADLNAASQGAPVVVGARRRSDQGDWFNTMTVVGRGGTITHSYDKHHLVPFGEYIPLADLMPGLGLGGLASTLSNLGGRMSAGPGPEIIRVDGLPPFVPMICYEAIFPAALRPGGQRGEWLVHLTNDAWFGDWIGPYQHLAQARFRAIEQGVPVARAANTGISAMIDPWGRVTASLALGEAGFVDASLPATAPDPLYGRTGDGPLLAILVSLGIGLAILRWRFDSFSPTTK